MNISLSDRDNLGLFAYVAVVLVVLLTLVHPGERTALSVSSSRVQVGVGNAASITVSGFSGEVSARSSNDNVAAVSYDHGIATIKGLAVGSVAITIWDKESSQRVSVAVKHAAGGELETTGA